MYGILLGHIFCKYGGWGWSELFFMRCLSRKSGSQHQLRIKTLPAFLSERREVQFSTFGLQGLTKNLPLKTQVPQKEVWCIPKSLFSREKQEKEPFSHQKASRVFVGDLFAEHWCIDFGLLIGGRFGYFYFFLVGGGERGVRGDGGRGGSGFFFK